MFSVGAFSELPFSDSGQVPDSGSASMTASATLQARAAVSAPKALLTAPGKRLVYTVVIQPWAINRS